jgi:anaerobic magnesium-protoporphyrin IX monomethyl ester cyclase
VRALLLSGLGPGSKSSTYLDDSLFDDTPGPRTRAILDRAGLPGLSLADLTVDSAQGRFPLLRPLPDGSAHLTTFTLESILQAGDHDYVRVPTSHVWNDSAPGDLGSIDVVLLSTTYIWNRRMLEQAIRWLAEHVPGVPIVAGGQYTNLKYPLVMAEYPRITAVVRGDGEVALPMLLDAMRRGGDLAEVPNLVWRDGARIRINRFEYIDLDAFPSPSIPHRFDKAPYESMRGCPFDCKFCSYPAASPKWRYKSAEKIRADWVGYAERNGVQAIEAMDSTFTVPPTRLRRLLEILPGCEVGWECYSRANVIDSPEFAENLLAAHCFRLVIGFESMNDQTLRRMSKRVTAKQNRRAFEILRDSGLDYSICFIVGYPGETKEEFDDTRRFLVDEFSGHFQVHRFGITDETMPLWDDKEALRIQVDDPYDSDSAWSHIGMTSDDAWALRTETLDEVRRVNDGAVLNFWQGGYERPLIPHADRKANLAVQKAVERLAMVASDCDDVAAGAERVRSQVATLRRYEVVAAPGIPTTSTAAGEC